MTVVAFLLLRTLNLMLLVVSSCGRCLCDRFSQSVFGLVDVSKLIAQGKVSPVSESPSGPEHFIQRIFAVLNLPLLGHSFEGISPCF